MRIETKRVERKNKCIKRTSVFLDGSRALNYIFSIKSLSSLIHPSIRPFIFFLSYSFFLRCLFLVWEALACFFPTAGGAPLVLALHSVDFAALFRLPATLPARQRGTKWRRWEKAKQDRESLSLAWLASGYVKCLYKTTPALMQATEI